MCKIMLFTKFLSVKKNCKFFISKRFYQNLASLSDDEPKYPPIRDVSRDGKLRYERQQFYDRIKALPTVEEKSYEITTNRNNFLHTYIFSAPPASYLASPFSHYVTRTHSLNDLPENLQLMNVDNDYDIIKSTLCEIIVKHFSSEVPDPSDSSSVKRGSKLPHELLLSICRNLAWKNEHLITSAFDVEPDVSSYWWHGGFESEKDVLDMEKKNVSNRRKKDILERANLCFQFSDQPSLTMRIQKPLPTVVPVNDPLCATADVIQFNYHPRQMGNKFRRRHITSIPGFWPGDDRLFPLLQVYNFDGIEHETKKLRNFDPNKVDEAAGIMASFGWLNGLALYHGFTPYHDLTYPIVGQTIFTNGQEWFFVLYQLNTITFHSDLDQKDKRNLCWNSGRMKLFESVENGEVKGLNDDVLKTIMKFALHTPGEVDQSQLTPYLGEDLRTEEEVMEMRKQARIRYRNGRAANAFCFEVPLWQHIYKRHPLARPSPWVKLQ